MPLTLILNASKQTPLHKISGYLYYCQKTITTYQILVLVHMEIIYIITYALDAVFINALRSAHSLSQSNVQHIQCAVYS